MITGDCFFLQSRYINSMFDSKLVIRSILSCLLILYSFNVLAVSEKIFQRDISGDNYQLLEGSGVKIFLSVLNETNLHGDGRAGNVQIMVSSIATVLPKLHKLSYATQSSNSLQTYIPIDFSDIQSVFSVSFLELRNARLNLYFDFSQSTNEER